MIGYEAACEAKLPGLLFRGIDEKILRNIDMRYEQ